MNPRRGPIVAGEKIQFTDRKGKKITDQLTAGGVTQTEHGIILHDDVIGRTEGVVVTTVTAKREAQVNADHPERDRNKPWKSSRAIGGWEYAVMRPRLADYVLSMPRGAQIMYPKDIAQVIQLGDIRSGIRVLESGAGSGAMSVNLLDAVGERGHLTTISPRSPKPMPRCTMARPPAGGISKPATSIPLPPNCPNTGSTASCSTCSTRGTGSSRHTA